MITKSESITNLSKAMLEFNKQMGVVYKDNLNPFFKGKYASLANILQTVKEPLINAGLTFTQMPDEDGLITMLIHAETGEFLSSVYQMPVTKNDGNQALGSAITYARRYAISSILGLSVDDDDDGNAADGKVVKQNKAYQQAKTTPVVPTPIVTTKDALTPSHPDWERAIKYVQAGKPFEPILEKYTVSAEHLQQLKMASIY
jgi:hypothetical protein